MSRPAAMSPNLRKGDRIDFDIDAANDTIVAIRVTWARGLKVSLLPRPRATGGALLPMA